MMGPTGAVRVMVATRAVDFRKGAKGLAVFCGAVYVFGERENGTAAAQRGGSSLSRSVEGRTREMSDAFGNFRYSYNTKRLIGAGRQDKNISAQTKLWGVAGCA